MPEELVKLSEKKIPAKVIDSKTPDEKKDDTKKEDDKKDDAKKEDDKKTSDGKALMDALNDGIDMEKGVHFSYDVKREYMDSEQSYETFYKDGVFWSACTTKAKGYESTTITYIKDGKVYTLDPGKKAGTYATTIPAAMLGNDILAMDPLYSAVWTRINDTNYKTDTQKKRRRGLHRR